MVAGGGASVIYRLIIINIIFLVSLLLSLILVIQYVI